jgi:hypothetical protein
MPSSKDKILTGAAVGPIFFVISATSNTGHVAIHHSGVREFLK